MVLFPIYKSINFISIILGFLLIIQLGYPGYCSTIISSNSKSRTCDISIEEFGFIFKRFIIPDLESWEKKEYFSFENMEIKNNQSFPPDNYGYATISIKTINLNVIIKYGIYKNIWHIKDKELKVFSLHGPRWQTPVEYAHDWCFVIDNNGTLYIVKNPKKDITKNINQSILKNLIKYIFPSDLTKEDFYNLCMFYITYLYALGEKSGFVVLNTVKDLPFFYLQDKKREPLKKKIIDGLDKILFSPALESFKGQYHLSLFTYLDVPCEIVKWDFDMGPDNNLNVRKTILFEEIPRLLR